MSLFNNIVFVGGIHGVGKTIICRELATELNIIHLSASTVLGWSDINVDVKNKFVSDILDMQDRLIEGLQRVVIRDSHYILDGHFCLFNNEGNAIKVPLNTFAIINPVYLVVIKGDVVKVAEGLRSRDQKSYSEHSLAQMQMIELEYAKEISVKLNVPLFIFDTNRYNQSYNELLSQLHESLA